MSSKPKPSGSVPGKTGRSTRVPRNAACTNCRRRKMKCDGKKPMCGPCSRSGTLGDCEFGDRGGTQADALEEQISILENRLQELENPNDPRSSMMLYDPYARSQTRPSTPGLGRSLQGSTGHGDIESTSSTLSRALVDAFLPHAVDLGFFLDPAHLDDPSESTPSPPHFSRALLSTVYLLGSYLSDNRETETHYLTYAVQSTSQGLSENHPQKVIHTIQSNILLSQYFFLKSRSLEANYHLSTAVALVFSAGLHKIRSLDDVFFSNASSAYGSGTTSTGTASGLVLQRQRQMMLPPPRDLREEGERINAMWTVLGINSCWTVAENSSSDTLYGHPDSQIDTPWPLDIASYSITVFPPQLRSRFTVQNFLANMPDQGYSLLALYAKASILFEQCTTTYRRYSPNMSLDQSRTYTASFESLNILTAKFISELPPIESASNLSVAKRLLVVHVLARVATIHLHYPFIDQNSRSHARIITSANDCVKVIRGVPWQDVLVIDPIMATLYVTIAQVLIRELARLRSSRRAHSSSTSPSRELAGDVESIILIMSGLAIRSPLMDARLSTLRADYAAAISR